MYSQTIMALMPIASLRKWFTSDIFWLLLIFSLNGTIVEAWDNEDLELFDLVEEVNYLNKTFYDVLGLSKDASSSDIRKAYHRLSLKLHPDHNKDASAEEQFRQLVSIAEVLRDENKRQKYDKILENGLPDWRQAVYYYRKVRKLGFLEVLLVLFFIVTLGQYIVSWSIYLERKYELEEVLASKLRKKEKKVRRNKLLASDVTQDIIAEELNLIPKPRVQDLLPFAIIRGIVSMIISLPHCYLILRHVVSEWRTRAPPSDLNAGENGGEERIRKPRRKRVFEIPEFSSECFLESVDGLVTEVVALNESELQKHSDELVKTKEFPSRENNSQWTAEDIAALTAAMVKIPSGVPGRWEKIAEQLNKPISDVTTMARTLKFNTDSRSTSAAVQGLTINKLLKSSVIVHQEVTERDTLVETAPLQNTILVRGTQSCNTSPTKESLNEKLSELQSLDSGVKVNVDDKDVWSQTQQKILEMALTQYPRGTEERWEKIAECVPNKTKEECMKRYKQLVELVKKKRNNTEKISDEN